VGYDGMPMHQPAIDGDVEGTRLSPTRTVISWP
jgi:hypothetical protein